MKKIVQRLLVAGMVILATLAGAAIGHAAPFAYIPYSSSGLAIVDQQTNKIATSISVGIGSKGVAMNSAGTRVYVTNFSLATVSVIDGINHTVIGSPIAVGTDPTGIIVSPDNTTVYVANEGSETISIINAQNNTVVHTITGVPCRSLAIDPSGRRLYVASNLNNQLTVIDTASRTVVGTPLTFANFLNSIAMNPTGTHLYVAHESASVLVIRTIDLEVTQVPVGLGSSTKNVAVHPSGSFVYAVSAVGHVYVIDAGANTVVASIDVGNFTRNVSFNSDGTRAFVTEYETPTIWVIDTATHTVIDTIEASRTFSNLYTSSFVAPHRHVWSGTTSFPIKFTGLGADGKFVKGAGELTGRVIEMRTLGGTPESKYSLLFLSDDMKSSIYLPDVTFLMTDVDGSKSEKFMMSGTGKYYFHDGTVVISGIANFNGTGTAKRDGPGGNFTQAKMSGTVTGGIIQGQYFTGKVKAVLDSVQ